MWPRVPYGTLNEAPTLEPIAHMFVGSKAESYEIRDELGRPAREVAGAGEGGASRRRPSAAGSDR